VNKYRGIMCKEGKLHIDLKEYLGKEVLIKIDRPLGSKHPKHDFIYELNYGYIPNTKSPDDEEIDAYLIGVNEPVSEYLGKCVAIICREDDDDDKLVIVPKEVNSLSDEEILETVNFQEKYFKSTVIRK